MPVTIQMPIALSSLPDEAVAWLLSDMKDSPDRWMPEHCEVTQQIGSMLMFETDRRRHNEDDTKPPRDDELAAFNTERLSPKDLALGLHLLNQRTRDRDLPERTGEFLDNCLDAVIALTIHALSQAYPDG